MEKYGEFEENGYRVEAFIADGIKTPCEWYVRVSREDRTVGELHIPMDYIPIFGPDVADVASLEEKVDDLLESLEGRK